MFECRGCGQVLPGRRTRVYCSNACQRERERQDRIDRWLVSGVGFIDSGHRHYIRRHIAAEQAGRCAICGLESIWCEKPLVLVLDHVDGDSTNNRRDNLRLVCPNCDSQLPTYKNRNRGRGRTARRTRNPTDDRH
ncbi:HNH endonuclease signature motif containing protein [Nocardioides sp.]|uniref:HNH endonuclease signature motif containing protein n=1 Tax=Nocardioides sp. TaxID=35761 RepID=UPI0025D0D55C|nr:HNH endonuclease signature motif containing protein [Nocardioides sp.]